jgi:hypothetical protein
MLSKLYSKGMNAARSLFGEILYDGSNDIF